MKRNQPNRQANIWVARGVPVFVLGIIGYGSWVVTRVICVDYLLRPPPTSFTTPQIGPAVAILVIYYILLCVMLICYARLLYVVTRYPGLVPRGSHWYNEKKNSHHSRRTGSRSRHSYNLEKTRKADPDLASERQTGEVVTNTIAVEADLKVEDFWKREVFTCGYDGRPAFCSSCYNWKPDRAHHCSELDRCVLKMDHFCPWVGGVVGENTFKFFLQFTFWAALFCTHVLVSVAYYLAYRKRTEGVVNAHWAIVLGISGLFLLFSAGMCMSSLQFILINSTTIENLSRKRKVWYIAVHVSSHTLEQIEERGRSNLRFITYPRPEAEQFQVLQQHGADISREGLSETTPSDSASSPTPDSRTFAILETPPGTNPFDLGWKENFLDLMGNSLSEWFFPIRPSPCVRHNSGESFYKMGSVLDQLKQEARIFDTTSDEQKRRKRSKHRRRKSKGPSPTSKP